MKIIGIVLLIAAAFYGGTQYKNPPFGLDYWLMCLAIFVGVILVIKN